MNTRRKYVVSTTLTEPSWANTTVVSGDIAASLRSLKSGSEGELQVHGSGALTRWLLANDLVDELTLLVVPVIVGQGDHLFPQDGPDLALELLKTHAFCRGIVPQTYRPAGAPQCASDPTT
ncbi:dihydrofolate reductase family protein [Nesterenkonia sp.]|uniref:dihydrofolate reductase family protein n=1 Tax=Nesterenkonia sp. TaxID=704201 RepID=UPI0026390D7A|nr:dihydrofolate reductase family protein [Nesterenkonia sp.]